MTEEQAALLEKAVESVKAARLLAENGMHDIAASRAYYAMFYAASAIILAKQLRFKRHSALHAAFGRDFARLGVVPAELHGWLLDAAKARVTSDYRFDARITAEEAAAHIERAERFITDVRSAIEKTADNDA